MTLQSIEAIEKLNKDRSTPWSDESARGAIHRLLEEHRRANLFRDALIEVLMADGIITKEFAPSGPDLLLAAKTYVDLKKQLGGTSDPNRKS